MHDISIQDRSSPDVDALLYDVLYRDFGVPLDADWRDEDSGGVIAVARDAAGRVAGCARLLPASGDAERQIRQLAVAPHAQGGGVGRELIRALEDRAFDEGARVIVLDARDTAWGFYERLGYIHTGPEFVSRLTGIVHRPMRRESGAGAGE